MHTLQKPYLCIPQIARMVGSAHPTETLPCIPQIWWAVPTLQKPYLCSPRGWWAVPTLQNSSAACPQIHERMVGGAHPTETLPLHSADSKDGGRSARMVGGAHPTETLPCIPQIARMVGGAHPTETLPLHSADSKDGGRCTPYRNLTMVCIPQIARGWWAVPTLQKPYLAFRR